jgi:uncharacterized protein (DUF305 family)
VALGRAVCAARVPVASVTPYDPPVPEPDLPAPQPDEAAAADRGRTVRIVVLIVLVAVVAAFGGWWWAQPEHPGNDSVDVGFLYDMTDHHNQAMGMSFVYRDRGTDPLLRHIASEIIAYQGAEIGMFNLLLDQWDQEGERPPSMAWMDMGHMTGMPGMATEPEALALQAATGRELDDQFTTLMIRHHEGGIHMAEEAADRADDGDVRWRAAAMAKGQRSEIVELNRWRVQHGLEPVD